MRQLRLLMLPSIALAGWIGGSYLLGDPRRTEAPSFATARELAPMWAWGILFLAGAIALTVTALIGNLALIGAALFAGGVIYSWWASLFAVTAVSDLRTSLAHPAIYYFIGTTHFAGSWWMFTRNV